MMDTMYPGGVVIYGKTGNKYTLGFSFLFIKFVFLWQNFSIAPCEAFVYLVPASRYWIMDTRYCITISG